MYIIYIHILLYYIYIIYRIYKYSLCQNDVEVSTIQGPHSQLPKTNMAPWQSEMAGRLSEWVTKRHPICSIFAI